MKQMLKAVRCQISASGVLAPIQWRRLLRQVQFHASYLLEVHCPIENAILTHLRERSPGLSHVINEMLADHAKARVVVVNNRRTNALFRYSAEISRGCDTE